MFEMDDHLITISIDGSDEEDIYEESDDELEDYLESLDHQSDSKQTEDDCEAESISKKCFVGRDGKTLWKKEFPRPNVRTRSDNIVTHLPGPINHAKAAKSPRECFDCIINEEVIEIITNNTNIYIENIKERFSRDRDAKYTDKVEVRALLGILYLIGVQKSGRVNVKEIWDVSSGTGVEAIYLTMPYSRFQFLLRCLRFDNINDREQRRALDKLAPIRELFNLLVSNFQSSYSPGEYLTLDEQLIAFRGRCSFRQYIPNKPAKYGLKIFALVDARTMYTCNLEVYVGSQPDGPFKVSNKPRDVVLRMVAKYESKNRNLTCDNWFSSVPLVKDLRKKGLTYVGTLRKDKPEIPPSFIAKNREKYSSIFGYEEGVSLVSYAPKPKKCVLVISSMHRSNAIDKETGEQCKPEMITFYNLSKCGVDLVDQMCAQYNVARNSRRWPLTIFFNLLNISGINAFNIYRANNTEQRDMKRREFLKSVALEWMRSKIMERSATNSLPRNLKIRCNLFLGIESTPSQEPRRKGVGKCHMCGRARHKSTRKSCYKCNNWVCADHSEIVCQVCLNTEQDSETSD